ncbi:hypothetical protein LINPERHAP1_LOCUS9230 [Linum perenne]
MVNMSRKRGGASQSSSSATTTHVFGLCPAEDRMRTLEAEVLRLSGLEAEVLRLSQLVADGGSSSTRTGKWKEKMRPDDYADEDEGLYETDDDDDATDDEEDDTDDE